MSDTNYQALVVDDEAIVRQATMRASREGFRCEPATDGNRAADLLETGQYDVVVTDLRMPNRHGHALAVRHPGSRRSAGNRGFDGPHRTKARQRPAGSRRRGRCSSSRSTTGSLPPRPRRSFRAGRRKRRSRRRRRGHPRHRGRNLILPRPPALRRQALRPRAQRKSSESAPARRAAQQALRRVSSDDRFAGRDGRVR